ncbi:MAG: excinuclease ABC subunit UvrA [Candidatus Eiseniibacteriota bacterium]|nr:MAG: excinuclease ABC subunit UvrA [Candidatus Eisenbacteria bacterium]
MPAWIRIRGARQHNLKSIDVDLPVGKITVVTGVSGSGKSTLAFDTLYAEGQRRYIESVSSYTRQFLERMSRPEVDSVEGLRPAVAIGASEAPRSARSTVGTATEIYDHLRLLFARIGRTYCSQCGNEVVSDTLQTAVDEVNRRATGQVLVAFSLGPFRPQEFREKADALEASGFLRAYFEGSVLELEELKKRRAGKGRELMVLVDRLQLNPGNLGRLTDSLATALERGGGTAVVVTEGGETLRFDRSFRCSDCGTEYIQPSPLFFSFNSPYGACPHCRGFGNVLEFDPELIVPDPGKTILQRAIAPWAGQWWRYFSGELRKFSQKSGVRLDVPFGRLPEKDRQAILRGNDEFEGVIPFLEKLKQKSYKSSARFLVKRCQRPVLCHECAGQRLRREALNVRVGGEHIAALAAMDVDAATAFFSRLELESREEEIARRILDEITYRLRFLKEVGLGYITLDRLSRTLSGGELRRIEIANALGSGLVDSLYVLDEPTTGLHARDSERLVSVLRHLCSARNTVVVVEHDREVLRAADWVVDLGPLAGKRGGEVVYQGELEGLFESEDSLTGKFLSGKDSVHLSRKRRKPGAFAIVVRGASEHNLKGLTVEIPCGLFVCVTGVSGSGKSTLVTDILYRRLALEKGESVLLPGAHAELEGSDLVEDVRLVDQTPIGKSPRSNPVTYVKAFGAIRQVFSSNIEARKRRYTAGTFSFNVPGGRCETCQGAGATKVEMYFLADVFVTCDACGGRRYKKEILDVKHRGKNISQVLELTVDEALSLFSDQPSVCEKLWVLKTVGLGYLTLGQPANALSGGEAQRLKIARELLQPSARGVLYIMDEPTVGLHPSDVGNLVKVLHRLVERGNTVVAVEHNIEFVAAADHCIDLGPEGGERGGRLVASGTPEQLARTKGSYTGKYLGRYLRGTKRGASGRRARSRK